MSDEIVKATWAALVHGRPQSKRALIRLVNDATGVSSPTQVEAAIKTLLADGDIITVEGRDIPWNFYDKRATTYYINAAFWKAEIKRIEEERAAQARQRLEELASDEADLALRAMHPVDYRKLFDAALKRLEGK